MFSKLKTMLPVSYLALTSHHIFAQQNLNDTESTEIVEGFDFGEGQTNDSLEDFLGRSSRLDQFEDYQGGRMIINLFQGLNECIAFLVREHGIESETKHMLDSFMSDDWVMIVENASKEQYEQELAFAIDPLAQTIMGISGDAFVETMSYEMSNWIKDTTILWVKNGGAGQTTTEQEIQELRQEDRHERELMNLTQFYEEKLQRQREESLEDMENLRADHQREVEIMTQDFKTKAKTLSEMYTERMRAAIDKTREAYEEQIQEDIQNIQNQCADQLSAQIQVYREQMQTCANTVDQHSDAHQALVEEKAACQQQLIDQTQEQQRDMIAREQQVIDNMTLQCEQEKEALIDQFSESLAAQHQIKVDDLEARIAELENVRCEPIVVPQDSGDAGMPDEGVKILIEMQQDGTYVIKQWSDATNIINFNNMIFEIYKNSENHLELVHWTEDELMEMFGEMKAYWDNEEFWDQVMIGYTDLEREDAWEHYQQLTIHQDACNVLAYHLNDQDANEQVQWECTDVWAGNADDLNLKRFRRNEHQMNIAINHHDRTPLPDEMVDNDIQDPQFTRGNGKCRNADGDFDTAHSYFPTGPNDQRPEAIQRRVRDIQGCKNVCLNDPRCTAFHFYMLDPGHYNNCWIWTAAGYTPNGSNKAFCFVKNEGAMPVPDSDSPFDQIWNIHDQDMGDHHHHTDDHDHHGHSHDDHDHDDHTHDSLVQEHRTCTKYRNIKGCVSGYNIQLHKRKTLAQCEVICNQTPGCVGFEYFVASGARFVTNIYEYGDCQPQSSTDTDGCDYMRDQLQFWRREEYDCDEANQEFWDNFTEEVEDPDRNKPTMDLHDYDIVYNYENDGGQCHEYLYVEDGSCTIGGNMEALHGVSLEECQFACSNTYGCLGIEYFQRSYSSRASDHYQEGDCNLNDTLDTTGCDAHKWQMYLWKQGWAVGCDEWRANHRRQDANRDYYEDESNHDDHDDHSDNWDLNNPNDDIWDWLGFFD